MRNRWVGEVHTRVSMRKTPGAILHDNVCVCLTNIRHTGLERWLVPGWDQVSAASSRDNTGIGCFPPSPSSLFSLSTCSSFSHLFVCSILLSPLLSASFSYFFSGSVSVWLLSFLFICFIFAPLIDRLPGFFLSLILFPDLCYSCPGKAGVDSLYCTSLKMKMEYGKWPTFV